MRRPTLALALTAVLLSLVPEVLAGRAQRVILRAEDGVSIVGTFYEAQFRPAPAVILVHMLNRSRRDWESLGPRLASAGIAALAIDLRGHGDSSAGSAGEGSADYSSMLLDLKAARRFLATRPDVQHSRIGILGASLGANLAALEAAEGGIASVALLSPSLDYRGLRIEAAARKYGKGPMLLVASDDDPYARRSALDLQKTGASRELLSLAAAGHGTNMLGRAPELPQALVDWFRRTLQ